MSELSEKTNEVLQLTRDIFALQAELKEKLLRLDSLVNRTTDPSPTQRIARKTLPGAVRPLRKGKRRFFSEEFKAKVAAEVLEQGRSFTAVRDAYQLSESPLRVWIKKAKKARRGRKKTIPDSIKKACDAIRSKLQESSEPIESGALKKHIGFKKTTFFAALASLRKDGEIVAKKVGSKHMYELAIRRTQRLNALKEKFVATETN